MGEITYTHETCWTDGLCFVIWKGGSRIARCDSKETAESICKTSDCHDDLVAACKFAKNPEAPFSSDQIEFARRILKAIADKAEVVLAKVRGEKIKP